MRKLLSATMGLGVSMMLTAQAHAAGNGHAVPNESWEHLWDEVMMDITVIGVIMFVLAIWMLIAYRASSPDQVGTAKKLTTVQSIAWALIPASIFMADDFYLAANGWTVWNDYRRVPENAYEIKVTAYQWYFEFEYPDGTIVSPSTYQNPEGATSMSEFDEGDFLGLPHNQPVVFRMTSDDVIHNFGLPHFRVKEDVMPGRTTYIYINPIDLVETRLQCA